MRPVLLTYDNVTDARRAGDVHRAQRRALRALCGAKVASALGRAASRRPKRRGFTTSETERRVQLADGREIAASLLVAAEGRNSPLREAAGIKVVGWSYPQTGIVTTVRHERPHGGRAVQHFLPAGPFAILPLTGNRSCITWTEDAARRSAHPGAR